MPKYKKNFIKAKTQFKIAKEAIIEMNLMQADISLTNSSNSVKMKGKRAKAKAKSRSMKANSIKSIQKKIANDKYSQGINKVVRYKTYLTWKKNYPTIGNMSYEEFKKRYYNFTTHTKEYGYRQSDFISMMGVPDEEIPKYGLEKAMGEIEFARQWKKERGML